MLVVFFVYFDLLVRLCRVVPISFVFIAFADSRIGTQLCVVIGRMGSDRHASAGQ